MNWIHLSLSLAVAAFLMLNFVSAEDSGNISFSDDEEEMLPSEQTVDPHDLPRTQKPTSAQSGRRILRQSYNRDVDRNTGFQFARGLLPAPFTGQPLDAQASSASKKMFLVLNNDENKIAELPKSAQESLKRVPRNPDVMDGIVEQFQELGGGMTQQLLQQVSESAPDMSKSFGQAVSEALSQTNLLTQLIPPNVGASQPSIPMGLDLGPLGQSLNPNRLLGATQNALGPLRSLTSLLPGSGAASAAGNNGALGASQSESVGAAASDSDSETDQDQQTGAPTQRNPEQNAGQSLLSQISSLGQLNPFGQLNPLGQLGQLTQLGQLGQFNPLSLLGQLPLMGLGSEISEVRVLPENNSPYKVSPKQVDHQTIAEMKLKAVLKDALTKKTIPILWFHLPSQKDEKKTEEELQMEAKLKNFEEQVIAELKQLQELARMANEVKKAQLQNGFPSTPSLTTKLNLFEIPLYEITLGDIESTLKDEQVLMLIQTLIQKKKDFQRHQQATTKYITDLTDTPDAPTKRQTNSAEHILQNMEKDDMLKMMTYAYRMAAINGHDMPWIKKKFSNVDETDPTKSSTGSQQRHLTDANAQTDAEVQWLREKQQGIEADRQRQMFDGRQQKTEQNPTMRPQMQQPQSFHRSMMSAAMQQSTPMQKSMPEINMPVQQQVVQRQMMQPPMISDMNTPMQQQVVQRQMMPSPMMSDMNMPMQHHNVESQVMQMPDMNVPLQQQDVQRQVMQTPMMSDMNMPLQQQGVQRQVIQTPMMSDVTMPLQQQGVQRQVMQTPLMPDMATAVQQLGVQRQVMQTPRMSDRKTPVQQQGAQMQMMRSSMMNDMNMSMQQQDRQNQMMPVPMMNDFSKQQPMKQMHWAEPNLEQTQRQRVDSQMTDTKSTTEPKSGQKPSMESNVSGQSTSMKTEKMSETEQTTNEQRPEHKQHTNPETTDKTLTDAATASKSIKSQMSENESTARMKGFDDFFDKMDLFNQGNKKQSKVVPTVINYYYSAGNSRYPANYPQSPSYGYSRGYGGGYGSYAPPQYRPAPAHNGGAAHGSNVYTYRTATGDEEIAQMLQQQQQTMPKMMETMQNNEESTTSPETKNDTHTAEHLIQNHPKSNRPLPSLPYPSVAPPPASPSPSSTVTTSSSSSSPSSQLSPSLPESSNDVGPEVASLFAFEPYVLQPFMGLHSIDRPDDPWHHKAYDLHQPLYTGGGTFEPYIKHKRYKRDLTSSQSAQLPKVTTNRNVLTPEMLARILNMKSNFKKHYPTLYKSMMHQLTSGKSTTISITPPEVPQHVSHKNLELAAAEITPLESLIHTYEEDVKKIMEAQKQQREHGSQESQINSYKNELNFWVNPREDVLTDLPAMEEHILSNTAFKEGELVPPTAETVRETPSYEEPSFWEDTPDNLNKIQEIQPALDEPQSFWGNSQENLKALAESDLIFQNPQEHINKPQITKDNVEEIVSEPQSFWENPHDTLKALTEQGVLFNKPQGTANEEQDLWEIADEIQNDTHKPTEKIRTSGNDDKSMWQPSVLQKRSSFWTELEALEEEKENTNHNLDDSEPIFDFDEDFD